MKIASLAGLAPEDLHPCFLDAFSDYLVPAQPGLPQLAAMLRRRGWAPELSAGAWLDGSLAGFWLCATPKIDGEWEGYCIAAGVAPAARRRHALTDMAGLVSRLLAAHGIRRQRLEVIDGNQRARDAYASLGFAPLRQLDCYQLAAPVQTRRAWPVTIHSAHDPARWPAPDALSYPQAVPNRRESLLRADPPLRWLTIDRDGQSLGSLLMSPDGEVAELQVDPAFRRQGVASQLLLAAQGLSPCGRLGFNNVDSRDLPLVSLLLRHQAVYRLSQWEMALSAAR